MTKRVLDKEQTQIFFFSPICWFLPLLYKKNLFQDTTLRSILLTKSSISNNSDFQNTGESSNNIPSWLRVTFTPKSTDSGQLEEKITEYQRTVQSSTIQTNGVSSEDPFREWLGIDFPESTMKHPVQTDFDHQLQKHDSDRNIKHGLDHIGQPTRINLLERSETNVTVSHKISGNLGHLIDQKHVLLMAYMRGGSSFLGQMFVNNPEAFFWFEIVDPMYGAMMGLRIYNNAYEVTHLRNGTKR